MNKGKTLTILIVDDEKINVIYLREVVKRFDGYTTNILIARNGKEAVDKSRDTKI